MTQITLDLENWEKLMKEKLLCTGYKKEENNPTYNLGETDKARAVVKTIYEINLSIFYNPHSVVEKMIEWLPDNFHLNCIPPEIIDKDMPFWFVFNNFLSFKEWTSNLPADLVEKFNKKLKRTYFRLAHITSSTLRRKNQGDKWVLWMIPFPEINEMNETSLAGLEIIDKGREYNVDKINWHGRNMSQMVFNCGVHFEPRGEGHVSIHT